MMDCTMQVDDNEIQDILNELKAEQQKYQTNLVEQKQLDDIAVICFTTSIQSLLDKLFHVSVKICDSISDLESLDIFSDKYNKILDNNTNIYVIQMYISNLFQSKLINTNWIANICITNSDNRIYKTIHIKNMFPSSILNITIPFPKTTKPVQIYTNLFLPSDDYWYNIKVSKIETDISYHFIPFYENKILQNSKICPLFQISRLYTDEIKLKINQPIFKYQLSCKSNKKHFFETVLKNCIHKLDINHMQLLLTNSTTDIQLHVNNSESTISLDTKNNILKISGTYENLRDIKDFLTTHIEKEQEEVKIKTSFQIQLQILKVKLQEERSQNEINFDKLKMLYQEYKNLIAELPV